MKLSSRGSNPTPFKLHMFRWINMISEHNVSTNWSTGGAEMMEALSFQINVRMFMHISRNVPKHHLQQTNPESSKDRVLWLVYNSFNRHFVHPRH